MRSDRDQTNGKRSLWYLEERIRDHLTPVFTCRRLATITTAEVRAYIAVRQQGGAANATINRELAILKRALTLAIQAGKLVGCPHIPMLREDNVRQGFFETPQLEAVPAALPEPIRPLVTFAFITGWRVMSEVLPLRWRQVDFAGGTVRLDPGTTKNREGRVFPLTLELRALLEQQRHVTREVERARGVICSWVFHRNGRRIRDFRAAWKAACAQAGCPGRTPHDFRRTAVRNFEQRGISRSVAMKLTGNLTEAVYRRYAIVSESDLMVAARRLDAGAGTTTPKTGEPTGSEGM